MARTYARILTSIWRDKDFCALPARAQHTYMLVLSQPDMSACGVVFFRPKRWATLAPDTSQDDVEAALGVLEDRGYVVIDRETDELWVRSFIKYDGVLKHPNMRKAMRSAITHVMSDAIADAIGNAIHELDSMGSGMGADKGKGLGEGIQEAIAACGKCNADGWVSLSGNRGYWCDHETALRVVPDVEPIRADLA